MPKIPADSIGAERLAEMADQGQDISAHFTNNFTIVRPAIQHGNKALTDPILGAFTEKSRP